MKNKKKKRKMQTVIEWTLNFVLAIILPVQLYLLFVGGFIFVSTLLGILAARKQREKISLKKLTGGLINKMFVYTPTVVALYYLDSLLLNELVLQFTPVTNLVTKLGTIIILGDLFASINKNFEILTGKSISERIKESFKMVLGFKKQYEDLTKNNED